ncbi:MAG: DUF1549 and DUF1553 domain-containing protein [Gemmataceae bacterium]|nr:DUF1549 and DUF1553 domain-containing protein [Gemmataceae bacterium]
MTRTFPILALMTALLAASVANARPPYKKSLADYYGPFLPPKLHDCRTCHVALKEGEKEDAEERDHNGFGARLKALRKELTKAGKKADIITRLQLVADEDADGDGVNNLLEILAGRNPGEADDKPTPAELAEARKKLVAFKARVYHRWDPFVAVQRPAVPQVKNASWMRNPIDAFLSAEHEQRGLKARPEAARPVLVRRVYLDLTGLPPTHDELVSALSDKSDDWYEKVVDRLLSSPRYGERWGRHWMDVWRYADWAGFGSEVRESREHIWQWRDWIVESLNEDKPYDRMIVEMLAGDEVAPDDAKTLRGTGFLVRHWYKFNRNTWLENAVEHTSKAFLGFTMNCARCHDHFFDTDVTQKNYYQFRAFFEPYDVRVDRLPGQPDLTKLGLPRVFDAKPAEPTFLFVRGNDKTPDKANPIVPGVPEALAGPALKIEPVQLPLSAYAPDKREFVIKETVAASEAAIGSAKNGLLAARRNAACAVTALSLHNLLAVAANNTGTQRAFDALELAELDVPLAEARHAAVETALRAEQLEDAGKKEEWKDAATQTNVAQRRLAVLQAKHTLLALQQNARYGATPAIQTDAAKKSADAIKALAKVENDAQQPATTVYTKRAVTTYPQTSTGRRLALARWIAHKDNPLTARVAMNHIWLRHFGTALVPSVFDFGANGQPPTHPALLDWLASEFTRQNWNMKPMHRLIVTSNAYRMDSMNDAASVALDRDNRYLWRMNSRRMEAELVRDSVLHVAGQLDLTMGGADVPFAQGLTSRRRSLYMQHAAEKQVEFLSIFDAANVTDCYQRSESVIPQQALALANSSLVLTQSRLLATGLTKKAGDPATAAAGTAFVKRAFEHVLGRAPTALEQTECEKFLKEQTQLLAEKKLTPFGGVGAASVPPSPVPHLRARENLVHVLMNHNDFVTIR